MVDAGPRVERPSSWVTRATANDLVRRPGLPRLLTFPYVAETANEEPRLIGDVGIPVTRDLKVRAVITIELISWFNPNLEADDA